MKRILSLVLALLLVFVMAGCSSAPEAPEATVAPEATDAAGTEAPAESEAPAEETGDEFDPAAELLAKVPAPRIA